jgi:hypothetical protein
LVLVAGLIHAQEALFIYFMTFALCLVETVRILLRHAETNKVLPNPASSHPSKGGELVLIPSRPACNAMRSIAGREGQGWVDHHWSISEWKPVILAAVLIVVFFAMFFIVRYVRPGAWISACMIMPHVSLPAEPVSLIFRDLMISPPQNPILRLAAYQLFIFYQVIGLWGLFVYLLFLVMIRRFIKVPYLTAGMVMVPLLTSFNPLTVDMIARLGQDPTIYRFHYLIPLPFVGGYLLVRFWDKAWKCLRSMRSVDKNPPRFSAVAQGAMAERSPETGSYDPLHGGVGDMPLRSGLAKVEAGGGDNICRGRSVRWISFVASMIVFAGLIIFMFPINAAGIYAPYSKIYTLRRIPVGNDCRLYADLEKFISKYENRVVLSDGWTAGFLWYFAPKNTYGWLKWFSSKYPERDSPDPYSWEGLRGRGLIVVNCRDGAPSVTGKISRHWPEDILKTSRHYSPEARGYLESHPEKFMKIWSQNRISVYAIR